MRILIVEDDLDIQKSLQASLQAESFAVDTTHDGTEGSYLARVNDYDLLILDNMLPGKTGHEICEDVRKSGKHVPILMLSVACETAIKVELLNHGADDYLTKPFSFEELLARVRVLLRRPQKIEEEIFHLEDLEVDVKRQRVRRADKDIYLTRKEFSLLEYLLKNQGYVVSRGMLMEHVWDANSDPFSNTLEAHILNLRKKIDTPFATKLIHTVPGRGYKIDSSA